MSNKRIFAENLKKYMEANNKTRREICAALGFSYYTFSDWVNGKKYPRMDKVEMLADYFGIQKSDLIEDKLTAEKEKDNDILANIIVRMRIDQDFFKAVQALYNLDSVKVKSVTELLTAFDK